MDGGMVSVKGMVLFSGKFSLSDIIAYFGVPCLSGELVWTVASWTVDVAVSYSWLSQYGLGVASGDFEAAANAASGG